MANKRYTTQLRIQAVDKYSKTVKAMGKTTGRFSDQVVAIWRGCRPSVAR